MTSTVWFCWLKRSAGVLFFVPPLICTTCNRELGEPFSLSLQLHFGSLCHNTLYCSFSRLKSPCPFILYLQNTPHLWPHQLSPSMQIQSASDISLDPSCIIPLPSCYSAGVCWLQLSAHEASLEGSSLQKDQGLDMPVALSGQTASRRDG